MIDINLSKCLVEKGHFGYDEYINICTHQVQDVVPWAAADYFGFSMLLLCTGVLVMSVGYLIYDSLK